MSDNLEPVKPAKFDNIDFDEIEYRSEYTYGKKALGGLGALFSTVGSFMRLFEKHTWPVALAFCGTIFSLYAVLIIMMLIKAKSTLLISGNGLTLKRPLLRDIEIPYSEIGSMEFKDFFTNMTTDGGFDLTKVDIGKLNTKCHKGNRVVIKSVDGKRKISIDQRLENFEQFCRDLATRKQLAEERYIGYARGTASKQPDRTKDLRAALESSSPKRLT